MNKRRIIFVALLLVMARVVHAQEPPAVAIAPEPASASKPVATDKAVGKAVGKTPAKGATRADRLDLETTVVSGNRELPKVLYIVPWKKADLGELPAQPFNTLLDEVLQPVDREVFKREVKYFQAISNGGGANNTKAAPTPPPVSRQ